jgi:DNA-binding response OmpR family regulator
MARPQEGIGAAKVLAVDDDPSILDLMTDILVGEGYDVLPAQNGAEALRVLEKDRPCVVLLDMRMPTLDGWGFASAMRDRGLRLPVVVVTAAENARAWAQEIGADAYLAKPFQLKDLLRVVERFCRHPNGQGRDPSGGGSVAYH